MNEDMMRAVGEQLAEMLASQYVFPDKGEQMAALLRDRLQAGAYQGISDADEFAHLLTADMHSVTDDLHLKVNYDPVTAENLERAFADNATPAEETPSDYGLSLWAPWAHHENYGFERVERLPGNIGYLDLRLFAPAQVAGHLAVAALNFLTHCQALIFDLRQNVGGDPSMIQLISSYLFEGEPQHLNSFYWRPQDETSQTWTLPYIPGKRFGKAPVYVLISASTFSAAEEFTYNLQHLKRATVVGERTGGGANLVDILPVCEGFVVRLPQGRAINPVTKTNWEGTGVTPDILISAERALETAHLHALDTLTANATSDELRAFYAWEAEAVRARYQPRDGEDCARLTGTYGHLTFIAEGGHLYRQLDRAWIKVHPLGGNRYSMGSGAKLEFELDEAGLASGVNVLNRASGQTTRLARSS